MDWLLATATIIIGLVGGYFIGRPDKAEREQALHNEEELRRIKAELADYRMGVTQHFSRSAELIDQMTNSYRSFYDHLVESSQRLCDDSELQQLQQQVSESKQVLPPKKSLETESLDVESLAVEAEEGLFDVDSVEASPESVDEVEGIGQARKVAQPNHKPGYTEQIKSSTVQAGIPADHVTSKKPISKAESSPKAEVWSDIMPEKELID